MIESSRWIPITEAHDIPLREGRAVEVDGREIALFNLGERFAALENRCPHRGGPLADGIVSGSAVVCPLHGWRLGLEDGTVRKPQQEHACVTAYPSRVENGVVFVLLQPSCTPADSLCAGAAAGCELVLENRAG